METQDSALACLDVDPSVSCGGIGSDTTFSYQACANGTHTFVLDWLFDPDTAETYVVDLTEGEIFQQSHTYDEPGKHSLFYEVEGMFGIGGSLSDNGSFHWDMGTDDGSCVELPSSLCTLQPSFDCRGVGQNTTLVYTACGTSQHTFSVQFEEGGTTFGKGQFLYEGDTWTWNNIYMEEGVKEVTFYVKSSYIGSVLNSVRDTFEYHWLVGENECDEGYTPPTAAPSSSPSTSFQPTADSGTTIGGIQLQVSLALALVLLKKLL